VLFLHENELTGSLPSELGRLSNLLYFYAHTNQLTGGIPTVLLGSTMQSLVELSLKRNSLQSTIASEVGQLTNLRYLDLAENDLTGPIPTELSRLTKLQALYLNDNNLSGTVPEVLALLWTNGGGYLADFHIQNNPLLSGIVPEELCLPHGKPCPRWAGSGGCKMVSDCTSQFCGCNCDCLSEETP